MEIVCYRDFILSSCGYRVIYRSFAVCFLIVFELFWEKTSFFKKSGVCFSRMAPSKGTLVALQYLYSKKLSRKIRNMIWYHFLFVSLVSIVVDANKIDLNCFKLGKKRPYRLRPVYFISENCLNLSLNR